MGIRPGGWCNSLVFRVASAVGVAAVIALSSALRRRESLTRGRSSVARCIVPVSRRDLRARPLERLANSRARRSSARSSAAGRSTRASAASTGRSSTSSTHRLRPLPGPTARGAARRCCGSARRATTARRSSAAANSMARTGSDSTTASSRPSRRGSAPGGGTQVLAGERAHRRRGSVLRAVTATRSTA